MSADFVVDNIYTGYGDVEILSGVSFQLGQSEFVGMIGPNGSGKTTLLRAMSRVLAPRSGAIYLQDADIYSISAREFARRVAVVPQDTLVAFDFSVLEIVLMGRSPRLGRFSIEGQRDVAIALDALERTGTAHLKDRQITALSGGERQRVMIARALAQEPEVLLLDEPTSHLDISFQFEIMDLIRSLNRERGMTILAVLHDLNLASQYCDRLIMMGQGRVFADGPTQSVITSDNIRSVYGAEVWVRRHPVTTRPYVISGIRGRGVRSAPTKPDVLSRPAIHVIGGGGTAAPALAKLARRGYDVTCGVLSVGDADQEVADALDIPYVAQQIFESISELSSENHRELMQAADVVLLMNMPVGHGNLANLEIAAQAIASGKLVIAIDPNNVASRDFTGGKASALIEQILSTGCKPAETLDEAIGLIEDFASQI
ncbi:MAG: ABC transporter ATP-binding protein [Armatimonadota bacterium]|jgi:iron complex transport system ATP-binding protein